MILSLFEEVLPIICCNIVLCTVGRMVGFVPSALASAWALCISAWTSFFYKRLGQGHLFAICYF